MKLALLVLLVLAVGLADYCETAAEETNFYVTPTEARLFRLDEFIKGEDLDYAIDDYTSAKLISPFATVEEQKLDLKEYTAFKSVDVRRSPLSTGMGFGALLAQTEDQKKVAVWMGKFDGYNKLPALNQWKFLTLPNDLVANCFDLKVIDDEGAYAVLDCQTIPQTDEQDPQDLLCTINKGTQELSLESNCNIFPAVFATRARKSTILSLSGKYFLLTSNADLTTQKVSVNYISIYHFNSNKRFAFNNIIDGTYLKDSNIEISDFAVGSDKAIIVADSLQSRLLIFSYNLFNQVSLAAEVAYQGRPLALNFNSEANTLLVATKDVINEHDYKSLGTIVNKYEVDPTDSLINGLSSSRFLLSFSTQNKNLYIYERKEHKKNYILDKVELQANTQYILSSQNSYVFTFNQQTAKSSYVAQPYIQITNLDKDKTIQVTAKSGEQICSLKLNLKYVKSVESGSVIVDKIPLQGSSFKVDSVKGLKVQLDNYFGGPNLRYSLPEQDSLSKDFTFDIQHLNEYPLTPSFPKTEASTILHISPTSFYYIGLNTISDFQTYIDICTLVDNEITCEFLLNKTQMAKIKAPIEAIKTYRSSNGSSIVLWSYKYSGWAEWVNIEQKSQGAHIYLDPQPYSSIKMTDNYQLLVSKTGRSVTILFQTQPFYFSIREDFFNNDQLAEVEYFYPRETYVDRTNQNIFYVKLPSKIAKFHIKDNHEAEYLGIIKSFKEYKPDNEWSINFDSSNIITYRDNQITEEYYNNVDLKYEKANSILYTVASEPLFYDPITRNSYFVSLGNPDGQRYVKIMKPFNGEVDGQYSDLIVKGNVAISGNWLLSGDQTPTIHFIDSHPTLTATSNIPEDVFKEDVALKIQVKSGAQVEQSTTEIEGVNYPVTIKNFPNNTILTLPSSARSVEIKLPVEKYFSGPVAYYSLSCPMCGGSRIHLYGPMAANKTIDQIPVMVDFVKYDDKVVGLSFNTLNLVNSKLQIIKTVTIPDIVKCTNLEYNENINIGLLVFCYSETTQEIRKYSILNNDFVFVAKYIFNGDTSIRNFDQMFAVNKGNKNFVFILDNDETVDSNKKQSTIKMYDLSQDFTYVGEWTSKTFGTDQLYPINDFQIVNSASIFVTIGNYGIGYATLGNDGQLSDVGTINLATIPDIKAALLDDSFFKQIEALYNKDTPNELKVFLTTTNSLNMVISLTLKDKVYSYKALKESYYRYGNERLLNWHAITKDGIYLSYYNEMYQQVNLVYYQRTENARTHFIQGVLIRVSKNQLKYHQAFIVGNKLITSHLSDVPTDGQLTIYNTYNDFVLWIDYEQGGKFDQIQIQAFNDYKQSSHIQPVKFLLPTPPTPDSDGLKWYIILIVALCVLIAVGAAYGLFIYMKKKRAEKSVSLLTEKEEDVEEEEDRKDILNDSTTKDGYNRSSINAD